MISAGQVGNYGNNYGNNYGGMPQNPVQQPQTQAMMPTIQQLPQSAPAASAPNIGINYTPAADDKAMQAYLYAQPWLQMGGMVNGMLTNIFNYCLAKDGMEAQKEVAIKYYDVMGDIASYQMQVATRQMDVQEKAIAAQSSMHLEQCRHEEKMAKLAGNTQVRLAAIAEKGKNERARIYSVSNAFSRSGWDMGSPSIAA